MNVSTFTSASFFRLNWWSDVLQYRHNFWTITMYTKPTDESYISQEFILSKNTQNAQRGIQFYVELTYDRINAEAPRVHTGISTFSSRQRRKTYKDSVDLRFSFAEFRDDELWCIPIITIRRGANLFGSLSALSLSLSVHTLRKRASERRRPSGSPDLFAFTLASCRRCICAVISVHLILYGVSLKWMNISQSNQNLY